MTEPSWVSGHHTAMFDIKPRLRAAGIHLGVSACIALVAAALVFGLWFRWPYREVSGGTDLFLIVIAVDVCLGPLITLSVFDRAKGWPVLRRDLAFVALLQLGGLAYGLWTVHLARPVHLVFEVDRFRVVHAADIPTDLAAKVPRGIDSPPWTGPTLLAVRPFRNPGESVQATMVALGGIHLAARPDLWEPYVAARGAVLQVARPVSDLRRRFPSEAGAIDEAIREAGRPESQLAYLPLVGRKAAAWTVLIDGRSAEVQGYLRLDSF
ncbi:TfpX/TfpZ family type IV pilin accessory protein [Ramlibacter sp.]|uniref:TfpX/TfpZ family type IV pilin accessory protein n=1 Tax=Ramlibacter sp. TaxID=1917967 RepID=UPI0035AE29C1